MGRRHRIRFLVFASMLALLLFPASFASAGTHTVTLVDLGNLGGVGGLSEAFGINDKSQIVGTATSPGYTHAFLWDKGVVTDLGTLGSTYSWAGAINNQGKVVGSSGINSSISHAFLWDDGVMTDLGTLTALGHSQSQAYDINNRGQVIGVSWSTSSTILEGHAFLWDKGVMTDLGAFIPTAINDRGQVVGSFRTVTGEFHAILWEKGVLTDLGAPAGFQSVANDINDNGQVVGYIWNQDILATPNDYLSHTVLWERGVMRDLGTLGGLVSIANGINNHGQIIGYIVLDPYWPEEHAVLWDHGIVTDLGTIPCTVQPQCPNNHGTASYAYDINEHGQMAGYGTVGGDGYHIIFWK